MCLPTSFDHPTTPSHVPTPLPLRTYIRMCPTQCNPTRTLPPPIVGPKLLPPPQTYPPPPQVHPLTNPPFTPNDAKRPNVPSPIPTPQITPDTYRCPTPYNTPPHTRTHTYPPTYPHHKKLGQFNAKLNAKLFKISSKLNAK